MSAGSDFVLDEARRERLGFTEAVFCGAKSPEQIAAILDHAALKDAVLLLTRLDAECFAKLPDYHKVRMDYDPVSRTGFSRPLEGITANAEVAIVTAGTSDVPVAREALRTLNFERFAADMFADAGVAGLWRILQRADELKRYPVVIVAAGMDAALPSVAGGLLPGLIIAVPTSVGYGVAAGGKAALNAILASCAPGIVTVNIDNGYGAACAAIRALRAMKGKGSHHGTA